MTRTSVYALARMADVASPDSETSNGAEFLSLVEEATQDAIAAYGPTGVDDDAIHEIADGCVPVYTHDRMLTMVDLAAYYEDLGDLGTPGDMVEAAAWQLYEVARRLARAIIDEAIEDACDCDPDEMLPCEQHMDVIAQREGASARTADDLLGVWVNDAISVDGVEVSPWGQSVIDSYEAALASNDSYGCRWLPEGSEGLMDDMDTLRYELETSLATLDQPVYTHWDDGYVMYRISDDSPLAGE